MKNKYANVSSFQLYQMRSTDPRGIDAELDRRNRAGWKAISKPKRATRRKPIKWAMLDYGRENGDS